MQTFGTEYKQAFDAYLRKGISIELSLKQACSTSHYVWRTRRDGRARAGHAANDGKIFAWDDPPATGHPGEDWGCRCTAEPFSPAFSERLELVMSGIADAVHVWKDGPFGDFIAHYRNGNGLPIRLRDTGHLQNVVDEYQRQRGKALLGQIADAAREKTGSSFSHKFRNNYPMGDIVYDLGSIIIGGVAVGRSRLDKRGALYLSGRCEFYLYDHFRDVLDILYLFPGDNLDLPSTKTYIISDEWQVVSMALRKAIVI